MARVPGADAIEAEDLAHGATCKKCWTMKAGLAVVVSVQFRENLNSYTV